MPGLHFHHVLSSSGNAVPFALLETNDHYHLWHPERGQWHHLISRDLTRWTRVNSGGSGPQKNIHQQEPFTSSGGGQLQPSQQEGGHAGVSWPVDLCGMPVRNLSFFSLGDRDVLVYQSVPTRTVYGVLGCWFEGHFEVQDIQVIHHGPLLQGPHVIQTTDGRILLLGAYSLPEPSCLCLLSLPVELHLSASGQIMVHPHLYPKYLERHPILLDRVVGPRRLISRMFQHAYLVKVKVLQVAGALKLNLLCDMHGERGFCLTLDALRGTVHLEDSLSDQTCSMDFEPSPGTELWVYVDGPVMEVFAAGRWLALVAEVVPEQAYVAVESTVSEDTFSFSLYGYRA